ncbi:hypothetical protein H6F38_04435 [Paenibacillus sp. EKM208P]|nr:hypothetical protein H6F38_04435 [Paenibacillus sp. EKM208P]
MNDVIKECIALESKYADVPFDKAIPHMQQGWRVIAEKHNTTADKVLSQYLDWKSEQKNK